MNRQEILEFINKVITTEHGKELTGSDLLTSCGMDSFGYAILFTELSVKYGIEIKDKDLKYNIMTLDYLVDMIIDKVNSNVHK